MDFTKQGYYRTRDNKKVYVVGVNPDECGFPIIGADSDGGAQSWKKDGSYFRGRESDSDLIAPWDGGQVHIEKDRVVQIDHSNLSDGLMIKLVRTQIDQGFTIKAAYHDGKNHVVWMERT